MEYELFVALVGALLNMVLSVIIPCLLKKSDQSFLNDVKKVFQTNREVIFASSLIVAITIYLALSVSPELNDMISEDNDYSGHFLKPHGMFPDGLTDGLPQGLKLKLIGRLNQ
jgi:phosphotransferase system  glucose/maltose/N-acetylglucosamine-specific IIC component